MEIKVWDILIITNKLGFTGTRELREVKVNIRKVDGTQNFTKDWKHQILLFELNILGSREPLRPSNKAKEVTGARPWEDKSRHSAEYRSKWRTKGRRWEPWEELFSLCTINCSRLRGVPGSGTWPFLVGHTVSTRPATRVLKRWGTHVAPGAWGASSQPRPWQQATSFSDDAAHPKPLVSEFMFSWRQPWDKDLYSCMSCLSGRCFLGSKEKGSETEKEEKPVEGCSTGHWCTKQSMISAGSPMRCNELQELTTWKTGDWCTYPWLLSPFTPGLPRGHLSMLWAFTKCPWLTINQAEPAILL